MDLQQPFLAAWVAIFKDGTQKQRDLKDFSSDSPPFLADINTKDVAQFFYIDYIGNKVYGVDVTKQLFLINGCLVQFPLPEGEYQLISFMRTPVSSNSETKVRLFAFGVQAEVDKKNIKRVCLVNPDGSVTIEE